MMRQHIYRRQPTYTHPIGTGGILVAAALYTLLFLAFMYGVTKNIILW